MAVLGVLLGLTMAALVSVCLYGREKLRQNNELTAWLVTHATESGERLQASELRKPAVATDDDQPKPFRPRTMGDVRRAAEAGVLPVEKR